LPEPSESVKLKKPEMIAEKKEMFRKHGKPPLSHSRRNLMKIYRNFFLKLIFVLEFLLGD